MAGIMIPPVKPERAKGRALPGFRFYALVGHTYQNRRIKDTATGIRVIFDLKIAVQIFGLATKYKLKISLKDRHWRTFGKPINHPGGTKWYLFRQFDYHEEYTGSQQNIAGIRRSVADKTWRPDASLQIRLEIAD